MAHSPSRLKVEAFFSSSFTFVSKPEFVEDELAYCIFQCGGSSTLASKAERAIAGVEQFSADAS